MSAVRFSNTCRASPICAPMYLEKNHKKYIKKYINYQNNSEIYNSKKINNTNIVEYSNNIFPLMMYIIVSNKV